MEHICAWRRPGESISDGGGALPVQPADALRLPSTGGNSEVVSPDRLVETFLRTGCLDYRERLEDGFYDSGPLGPSGLGKPGEGESSLGGAISPVSATLVVDRRSDGALVDFLDRLSKKLLRTSDAATRVMVTSLLVSESLGRSGQHASSMQHRLERLIVERADPRTGVLRLGDILNEAVAPAGGPGRQPGAGAARHRAVLFKASADWLGVAPCTLRRSSAVPGSGAEGCATWNTVLVDGEAFVVDVMFDPGALYEEDSGKATEYLKRLQQEGGDSGAPLGKSKESQGQSRPAPSMQQGLGGRMLRPSWHVEPWEIDFDRRDRAGRGGFGEVFQGSWAGQPVAVKEVRDANPTDGEVCDFILEISLLSRLSHPNVIRFWRGCVDLRGSHRTLLLVTEWMDRGVLSAYLHESQEPNLQMEQIQVLAAGIGRGVAYLHHVRVLHLDLKSPNVLLNSLWQAKLCDFGLAKLRQQTALHTTLRGVSPIWAPPEMFDEKAGGVTEKADVYSFGIIIFELATRKLPYKDVSQMQLPHVKTKGQLPRFPDSMNSDLAELSRQCLSLKPSSRPAMRTALTQLQRIANSQGIDLDREQARMEQRGLHFGASGPGGGPNIEQLRRAEAEKRRAEAEVARLRKLLQEEEGRLHRLLAAEEAHLPGGQAAGLADPARIQEFCDARTQPVSEAKFRCAVCRKLFRGPQFVHKHIREKHLDELFAAEAPTETKQPSRAGREVSDDVFFDADVAEESNARMYTRSLRLGPGPGELPGAGVGSFQQALQDAAEAGDLSRLQRSLQQAGAQLDLNQTDNDGLTPMHLSAKQGHAECVRYLISSLGSVNSADESGLTPLHLAAQQGHAASCEALLEAGAAADAAGSAKARTPLQLAAAAGQRDACALLLLCRACAGRQDEDGEGALHSAARFGDRELCELLLSWGASAAAADRDGWAPLHEAARWGDGGLVEALLRRGADPAARSHEGESALHVVPGGYAELEVVQVLVLWHCEVNCSDYDGETPLHVAVRLGDAEVAAALLNCGADANSKNATGATPLDFARKDEIRWLLRSHKAKRGVSSSLT